MVNKEPLVIHQSSLKTYRRCHRAYHYKYVEQLEKKRKSSALLRGTCVHEMIEAKANGQDPWDIFEKFIQDNQPVFTEQDTEYEDMINTIESIMEGYFSYYKKDEFKPVKVGDKYAEHKFSVELIPGVILEGIADMIVEHEKLGIGLMDHKTHKTLPQGDIAYSNVQSALYAWALRESPELPTPKYMVWNYIRWKSPTKPKLLKSGAMSKSVSDTTWRIYRKALLEVNLNPEDYKDVRETLNNKESDFYVRQVLPLNETIIENIRQDAISTARQILANPNLKDRNITRDCSWCEFYPLCQAQLKGLDDEIIKKCEYQPRKRKEEMEDEISG